MQVILIHLHRVYYWRRNSSPFISGDVFSDLATFNFNPPRFRNKNSKAKLLENSEIIFVSGYDLEGFVKICQRAKKIKVLIVGNSDRDYFNFPLDLFPDLKLVLLQNSFISDNSLIATLPIGVENLRWGLNGKKKLLKFTPQVNRQNRILVGPFGNTHPSRGKVVEKLQIHEGPWDVFQGYVRPKDFQKLSSCYRYVACVRGNGVDSHRIWECLYRGAIPILLRDKWSESLLRYDLPILLTDSWEPNELSDLINSDFAKNLNFNPKEVEALWTPYWIDYIKSKSRSSGSKVT